MYEVQRKIIDKSKGNRLWGYMLREVGPAGHIAEQSPFILDKEKVIELCKNKELTNVEMYSQKTICGLKRQSLTDMKTICIDMANFPESVLHIGEVIWYAMFEKTHDGRYIYKHFMAGLNLINMMEFGFSDPYLGEFREYESKVVGLADIIRKHQKGAVIFKRTDLCIPEGNMRPPKLIPVSNSKPPAEVLINNTSKNYSKYATKSLEDTIEEIKKAYETRYPLGLIDASEYEKVMKTQGRLFWKSQSGE